MTDLNASTCIYSSKPADGATIFDLFIQLFSKILLLFFKKREFIQIFILISIFRFSIQFKLIEREFECKIIHRSDRNRFGISNCEQPVW